MALFGGASDGRREPRSLVEFRAGKMTLSRGTVTADTRKGLVYMKTSDSLLHFCWKDRQTGEVVDDLIIFPSEADFIKVPQCTTGRVFLLKFKDHSSRRFFYWMQEPSNSKDDELAKKVNDLLTHPPDLSSHGGEGMGGMAGMPPGYMAIPSSQLQSLLGGSGGRVDHQQLMELLGGAGGFPHALAGLGRGGGASESQRGEGRSSQAAHTPASSAPPPAVPQAPARPSRSAQQQLDDLQSILSSLNVPGEQQQPQQQAAAPQEDGGVSLNEVFSSDVIRPLTNDEEVVSEISAHLPSTGESAEDILSSPQFQSALSTFHSGLTSGQLGPLMSQFGLGEGVTQSAASGNLRAFADALQSEMGVGGASEATVGIPKESDSEDQKTGGEDDGGGDGEGGGGEEGEGDGEEGGDGEGGGEDDGGGDGEGEGEDDGGGDGEGGGEGGGEEEMATEEKGTDQQK